MIGPGRDMSPAKAGWGSIGEPIPRRERRGNSPLRGMEEQPPTSVAR